MENSKFSLDDEIIDIEWCSSNNHRVPKGRKYRIDVNHEKYVVEKESMTGSEILTLVGKVPYERYLLRQKLKGGSVVTIAYNQIVDFTQPGIEKFKTLPIDQTEGSCEIPSRDFVLLEEDEAYLESLNLPWEAVSSQNSQWIFIHNYKLPEGYNVKEATLGVRINPGYPYAQLDMIYFHPALSRTDGQPIGGLSLLKIEDKDFQQWSRHRTPANPWRPEIDNFSTHIPLAEVWLQLEFKKRPIIHAVPA